MAMRATQFLYFFFFFLQKFLSHPEAKKSQCQGILTLADMHFFENTETCVHLKTFSLCLAVHSQQQRIGVGSGPGESWFILVSVYVLLPSVTGSCTKQIAGHFFSLLFCCTVISCKKVLVCYIYMNLDKVKSAHERFLSYERQ